MNTEKDLKGYIKDIGKKASLQFYCLDNDIIIYKTSLNYVLGGVGFKYLVGFQVNKKKTYPPIESLSELLKDNKVVYVFMLENNDVARNIYKDYK